MMFIMGWGFGRRDFYLLMEDVRWANHMYLGMSGVFDYGIICISRLSISLSSGMRVHVYFAQCTLKFLTILTTERSSHHESKLLCARLLFPPTYPSQLVRRRKSRIPFSTSSFYSNLVFLNSLTKIGNNWSMSSACCATGAKI